MDQCVIATLSLAAPLILCNFAFTFSAVIIGCYVNRILWKESDDDYESSKNYDSESDEAYSIDSDDELETIIENEVTDADLIASVREVTSDTSSNLERDLTQSLANIVQKASDVLNQDANVPISKKDAIIAIVKKTLHVLDENNHVPAEKQQTITSILNDIPNIIVKMKNENNNDLEVLLEQKATEVAKLTSEQESNFLMNTLDALQ